jgi:hypothetical protein
LETSDQAAILKNLNRNLKTTVAHARGVGKKIFV